MSDATTCSCLSGSVDKCSVRSCGSMFQEPFFLHPPGSRPRDGLYINPMTSAYQTTRPKEPSSNGHAVAPTPVQVNHGPESFYLHSPHDLVYTRITHLFEAEAERRVAPVVGLQPERKDDTLTVKVDVHINNGTLKPMGNGSAASPRSDLAKDSGSEHAYEQICIRQEDQGSPKYATAHKKLVDNGSDGSRSRKMDRRYSRSSSASESSNLSSEVHCYSSTTSTPSLSRNSSNERTSKSPKVSETLSERKTSTTSSTRAESEKESKPTTVNGPSIFRPPPPPPPPPPPEADEVAVAAPTPAAARVAEAAVSREEKRDAASGSPRTQRSEAAGASAAGGEEQPRSCEAAEAPVGGSPPPASEEDSPQQQQQLVPPPPQPPRAQATAAQVAAHLVNRHMVLPFIPPKFASQAADSETLLKPSEYLRSICKAPANPTTATLSKARSVDNLDIQSRNCGTEEIDGEEEETGHKSEGEDKREESAGPPPPPLPPPPVNGVASPAPGGPETPNKQTQQQTQQQPQQPLATISIQDLTSVQLRRTNLKMNATKTFSPPNRSVSMTNVSEPFFVQKTDLIAELKKTKDIPGIKKLKVQRAQVEKSQEQNLKSEISKAFSISNFVDQIPEKDSSGNVIPIWKRQMLARKAAERAKKELEEQIARENEEKRQKAIPPWKRQLLAKKDSDVKSGPSPPPQNAPKVELPVSPRQEPQVAPPAPPVDEPKEEERNDAVDDSVHIIPWRAQLRKTNSKLNILD